MAEEWRKHRSPDNDVSWTNIYRPIDIFEVELQTCMFQVSERTEELMSIYGVDNVRGGEYSQVRLSQGMLRYLAALLDICHRCPSCNCLAETEGSEYCERCGRSGHHMIRCNEATDRDGTRLPSIEE